MADEKSAVTAKAADAKDAAAAGTEKHSKLMRRIVMPLVIVALLVSGATIGVLFSIHRERTLAGGTVQAKEPEAPLDRTRDLIERLRKRELSGSAANLMPHMRSHSEGGSVLIHDKTTPKGYTSNSFYLYLVQNGEGLRGRLVIGCISDNRLDPDEIKVRIDSGEPHVIDVGYDLTGQNLSYIGRTYEFVDLSLADYRDVIRRVCDGGNALVSLEGRGTRRGFRLSYDQVDAVRRVFSLYEIYDELGNFKPAS
ncbi:MAG: hypothetical protein LBQ56_07810 [Synergistaceae bacterium]|nr:hypothetical protein [Synergistaceae bacterium]